jgi:hypothetical protein
MISWPQIFQQSPINWLLEKSNPSVRYFTLHDVVGNPEDYVEMVNARKSIVESAIVKKILRKQSSGGYWEEADSPYLPKYKSSY